MTSAQRWCVALCVMVMATTGVPAWGQTALAHAVLAQTVLAQANEDDAPIQYDDDPDDVSERQNAPIKKKKKKKKGSVLDERLREDEEQAEAAEESMAHLDDPNVGIGAELVVGLYLLESSRGAGSDPRFAFGARVTWEFGRLIPDEFLREMFFVDVGWNFTSTSDGTTEVKTASTFHNFMLAPAVAIPFGKSSFSAYAQVGAGIDYNTSTITTATATDVSGVKFLFQYGIGLRARPALNASGSVRLTLRLELTRYVRGYMHDTLIALGAGILF